MSQIDLSAYKTLYFNIADSYIQKIKAVLSNVSRTNSYENTLNDLYISFHSLGSQSSLMGHNQVSSLSKAVEKLVKNAIEQKRSLSGEELDVVKLSTNQLESSFVVLKQSNFDNDLTQYIKKVEEFL